MFDEYAKSLIDLLPDLPELDRAECRRALSIAYYYILRAKLNLGNDETSEIDLESVLSLLHRMIDTLESIAVFDPLNGQARSNEVETACAFVAAEALFLLGSSSTPGDLENIGDPILGDAIYCELESGLLYMVGGYDINALAIAKAIPLSSFEEDIPDGVYLSRVRNANALLSRIIHFLSGNVWQPRETVGFLDPTQFQVNQAESDNLLHKVRASFYQMLGEAIDLYLDWLGGYNENGFTAAVEEIERVRAASLEAIPLVLTTFADVYHLSSLLLAAINKTSTRSLVHGVPLVANANNEFQIEYQEYLQHRSRGDASHRGRPFLWPSAMEFINNCMPGPNRDAVISMPTGSGKGSIAELAIAQALRTGWVLYLAPTHALVHQVRRDLIHALQPFHNNIVRAFLGQEEYTTLAEEQININDRNFVAVMTPEKCSLALRLYPEVFATCSLCIFDECHLINDKNRGITADILLAQLSMLGQAMRFILMSAMVSNPEELAAWLGSIHDRNAIPLTVKWRPSRTMRGLLVIDSARYNQNRQQAEDILRNLPPRRVNQRFQAPLALIAGLSGPWTMDGPVDYRITNLPIDFIASESRRNQQNYYVKTDGWKNTASRKLAELLSRSGIPTICFILTSRHHTFSLADDIEEFIPGAIGDDGNFPNIVEAWLSISDEELGRPTILRELLRKGVAVHSSAMLQTEQAASEWMFLNKKAFLLFATGTLAQGLNLPAVAVIVAGTSLGDARFQEMDELGGTVRANTMILNGFGRAGRPGFSNQGLAVLVSDIPYSAHVVRDLDPSAALNRYGVLGEQDAAIEVHSPVETFIDNLIAGDLNPIEALPNELVLTSLLAEYDEDEHHSGQILTRTFAGYHKRQQMNQDTSNLFRERFAVVRENYFNRPDFPDWLNKAAMISGVDYFRASKIWQAYNLHGFLGADIASDYTIEQWLSLFFEIMSLLPPSQIQIYLPSPEFRTNTILTRMRDSVVNQVNVNLIPWAIPPEWTDLWHELRDLVWQYLRGDSYSTIAQSYLTLLENDINNQRSRGDLPIPAVFGFINRVVDQLAIDAGCFVAIHQLAIHSGDGATPLPESLQALPLCIRHGCDSLGSLAWYRFGYRQRVCAHALQRNFQVPDELLTDSDRAEWVRQIRRTWLAGNIVSEDRLVNYARVVLIQTEDTQ